MRKCLVLTSPKRSRGLINTKRAYIFSSFEIETRSLRDLVNILNEDPSLFFFRNRHVQYKQAKKQTTKKKRKNKLCKREMSLSTDFKYVREC